MLEDLGSQWAMYMDGALNANGSIEGLILINPEGEDIQYTFHLEFPFTNNKPKDETKIASFKIAKELGVQYLKAYSDSQLVVGHVLNEYEAKEENIKKYL